MEETVRDIYSSRDGEGAAAVNVLAVAFSLLLYLQAYLDAYRVEVSSDASKRVMGSVTWKVEP